MFARQISIESRKTLKHPALWAGICALLLLLALFVFIRHAQIAYGYISDLSGLEYDLITGLSSFNWIGGFVYALTASVIAAYDYPERSIQIWLILPSIEWTRLSRRALLWFTLAISALYRGERLVKDKTCIIWRVLEVWCAFAGGSEP